LKAGEEKKIPLTALIFRKMRGKNGQNAFKLLRESILEVLPEHFY
jgi:hypothetical protein